MTCEAVLRRLRAHANPANVAGMARYGISAQGTLGVSIPVLRALAKELGRQPELAHELWDSGVHEARILATLVADPQRFSARDAARWIRVVDSWDVCDALTHNVLRYTPYGFDLAKRWVGARPEFQRRCAFGLMAGLAVKAKAAADADFAPFFPLILAAATDDRNMVKKAVNWALRQIGKRSAALHRQAIACALEAQQLDSRAARWIAADALRELRGRSPRA